MKKAENFYRMTADEVSKFKLNKLNREVNKSHVDQLKHVLEDYGEFTAPIVVNKHTGHILDGQHRRKAFVDMVSDKKIPEDSLILVLLKDMTNDEEIEYIQNMNMMSKHWTGNDKISTVIKSKNPYYETLHKWCVAHDMCTKQTKNGMKILYTYGASFITGKRCSINDGKFTFDGDDMVLADTRYNEVKKIVSILYPGEQMQRIDNLVIAWEDARGRYDFKDYIKQIRHLKNKITRRKPYTSSQWADVFSIVATSIADEKRKSSK